MAGLSPGARAISGTAGNGTTLTTALAHAWLPNGHRVYIQSELSAIVTLFTVGRL